MVPSWALELPCLELFLVILFFLYFCISNQISKIFYGYYDYYGVCLLKFLIGIIHTKARQRGMTLFPPGNTEFMLLLL